MTNVSKEEYLKKYMSGENVKPKKKRLKVKQKGKVLKPRMKIIDDDISVRDVMPADQDESRQEELDEELPTVAEVVDERPDKVKQLESFRKSDQWKVLGATSMERHDSDSDASPVRGSKPDISPPRRRRHDSDDSPPRRQRHDSDESPPRRQRHDSDESPPRRRARHDSDESPPRRKAKADSDSDTSPPRRNARHDSDESPPRRKVKDDFDESPPRRKKLKQDSDSDQSPPRVKKNGATDAKNKSGKMTKTLAGTKAGLSSAKDMKRELEEKKRREEEAFDKMDAKLLGKGAASVKRDRETGKRRDLEKEDREKAEEEKKKAERTAKYKQWSKGLVQQSRHDVAVVEAAHEMDKPLARARDDQDLDVHLREIEREDDPMAAYFAKKKKAKAGAGGKVRPRYQGPAPPPNRFGIYPGYRWDGVDRSSGFEKKLFQKQSDRKATADEAYKWSVEDM